MRNILWQAVAFVLICTITSCQVTKRRYVKGFYVHHKSQPGKNHTKPQEIQMPVDPVTDTSGLGAETNVSFEKDDSLYTKTIKKENAQKRPGSTQLTQKKGNKKYRQQTFIQTSPTPTEERVVATIHSKLTVAMEMDWPSEFEVFLWTVLCFIPVGVVIFLLAYYPVTLSLLLSCWFILALEASLFYLNVITPDKKRNLFWAFIGSLAWLFLLPGLALLTFYTFFVWPFSSLLLGIYVVACFATVMAFGFGIHAVFRKKGDFFQKNFFHYCLWVLSMLAIIALTWITFFSGPITWPLLVVYYVGTVFFAAVLVQELETLFDIGHNSGVFNNVLIIFFIVTPIFVTVAGVLVFACSLGFLALFSSMSLAWAITLGVLMVILLLLMALAIILNYTNIGK